MRHLTPGLCSGGIFSRMQVGGHAGRWAGMEAGGWAWKQVGGHGGSCASLDQEPEPEKFDPQDTPAVQGPYNGRGDSPGSSSHQGLGQTKRLWPQEAFVVPAHLGHSLKAICWKRGFTEAQAEVSSAGGGAKVRLGGSLRGNHTVGKNLGCWGHSSSPGKFGKYCVIGKKKKKKGRLENNSGSLSQWGSDGKCFLPSFLPSVFLNPEELWVIAPRRDCCCGCHAFNVGCKFGLLLMHVLLVSEKKDAN